MKPIRLFLLLTAALLHIPFHGLTFAQDDFKKWAEKQNQIYQNFQSEADKNFSGFLKSSWSGYDLSGGIKSEATSNRPVQPVFAAPKKLKDLQKEKVELPANPSEEKKGKLLLPIEQVVPAVEKTQNSPTQNSPVQNSSTQNSPVQNSSTQNSAKLDLEVFSVSFPFSIPNGIKIRLTSPVDNKAIGEFWDKMSSCNYKDLLGELMFYKENRKLNDWGYCQLLNSLGKSIYPNPDERHLFTWFFLNKSGYNARAGLISGKVYLLLPSLNQLFDVTYIKAKDGQKIFIINFDDLTSQPNGELYTYDRDYSASGRAISMTVTDPVRLSSSYENKRLSFEFKDTVYSINVKYNKAIVEYYKNYPYTELPVYFNNPVSEEIKQTLLESLRPLIKNRTRTEAANLILHFCQKAFEYKLDADQFGREKPMFLEEVLFYKYCDCKDRAILYSFLIKNLLDLKVIALNYPGHVCTAVAFPENVPGDYMTYKGKRFLICDPTYMNADIGMCMPDFRKTEPKRIFEL